MFLPIRKATQPIYSYNQLSTSMSTMINHQKVYSSNIPHMFLLKLHIAILLKLLTLQNAHISVLGKNTKKCSPDPPPY
jgi:hypothetical protein